MNKTKTPLHQHMMIVFSDGDIVIVKKTGVVAYDIVAHFSYNMGDNLEENILHAHFFMDCLEQGLSFDQAREELHNLIWKRKENEA